MNTVYFSIYFVFLIYFNKYIIQNIETYMQSIKYMPKYLFFFFFWFYIENGIVFVFQIAIVYC